MKVYVDTNIVSRLSDLNVSDEVSAAFQIIARDRSISCVTSEMTRTEVMAAPNLKRAAALELIVAWLGQIPTVDTHGAMLGYFVLGRTALGAAPDPVYQALSNYMDDADASHIANAVAAGCDYFLTLDEKTILSPGRKHEQELRPHLGATKLVSPVELAAALTG